MFTGVCHIRNLPAGLGYVPRLELPLFHLHLLISENSEIFLTALLTLFLWLNVKCHIATNTAAIQFLQFPSQFPTVHILKLNHF